MSNTARAQEFAESTVSQMEAAGFTYDEFLQVHNHMTAIERHAGQNYGRMEREERETKMREIRSRFDAMPFLAFNFPHPPECDCDTCTRERKASVPPLQPALTASGTPDVQELHVGNIDTMDFHGASSVEGDLPVATPADSPSAEAGAIPVEGA